MALGGYPTTAAPVIVRPLVGPPVRGEFVSADRDSVVVDTPTARRTIAADALPYVEFPAAPPESEAAAKATGLATLVGGSRLPLADLAATADDETLTLAIPQRGRLQKVSARFDAVASVRLPSSAAAEDASLQQAWQTLLQQPTTSDLIVTRRAGGTLDYLEGYVEAIGPQTVTLFLNGESVEAPRSRVFGFVFAADASGEQAPRDGIGPRLKTADGAEFSAERFSLKATSAGTLRTLSGMEVSLAVDRLRSIDYRAGRLIPLSGLAPISSRLEPLFGTPRAIAESTGAAPWRDDRSYWGGTLTLRDASEPVTGLRTFASGIALRSGGEVVYAVPPNAERAQCIVGMDPAAGGKHKLRLLFEGDGKLLREVTLAAGDQPVAIDVPLNGARRLRLLAERLEGTGASVHLGDARLVR